jgi:hypothetical protein
VRFDSSTQRESRSQETARGFACGSLYQQVKTWITMPHPLVLVQGITAFEAGSGRREVIGKDLDGTLDTGRE